MDLQKRYSNGDLRDLRAAIGYLEKAEGCIWATSREDAERLQQMRFDVEDAVRIKTDRRTP